MAPPAAMALTKAGLAVAWRPSSTPSSAKIEGAAQIAAISRHPANFVCVCDGIFEGGEDYDPWTAAYVGGLAHICRTLAAEFDVVCEMTMGLPHVWKGELPRA